MDQEQASGEVRGGMNSIDAERNKVYKTRRELDAMHDARGYCPGYFTMTVADIPMTEQADNELICEKLLGWVRWKEPGQKMQWKNIIDGGRGWTIEDTPTFETWAEAGMILEALQRSPSSYQAMVACERLGERLSDSILDPTEIRAAALAYLRAQE